MTNAEDHGAHSLAGSDDTKVDSNSQERMSTNSYLHRSLDGREVHLLTLDAHTVGGRQQSSSWQDHIAPLEGVEETQSHFEEETADRGIGALHHIRSRTRSRTNENVIGWLPNDPENPYNWSNVSI